MAEHHHAEHVHGTMNIRTQERTFAGFIRVSIWVVGISLAALVFMALVNA